jgi:hypothetical protein
MGRPGIELQRSEDPVTLTPRKLLSAAALATLAACGHAAPAVRTATLPTPTVEASASTPVPQPALDAPVPVPDLSLSPTPPLAFLLVATPMCDANGRPLAGNVRTKSAQTMADCNPVTASR